MFKRKVVILGILVVFFSSMFAQSVCATEKNDSEITDITIEEYEENIKDLNSISAVDLKGKINNKETFVIYFGRATCPYCRNLSPILKKFNEKIDKELFYFNTEGKDNDEEMKKYIAEELGISSVPTTLSFVDGEPINGWVGDDATVDKLYDILVQKKDQETIESKQSPKEGGSNISNEGNQILKIVLIITSINLLVSILVILLQLFKRNKA